MTEHPRADSFVDHRSRAAERRRHDMRRRLLESAVLVFAEKGFGSAVIDDVIVEAGVSRGTFYKYFPSTRDVMVAASEELANDLMALVEQRVVDIGDPALRIATGLRLFIATTMRFPLFARFIRATGLEAAGPTTLIYEFLPPHLTEGISRGQFTDAPLPVSLDLITGAVLLCVARVAEDSGDETHSRHVVASILRGLGMTPAKAWAMANADIAPLSVPDDSLIRRAQLRQVSAV